jgi:hypothetical protein
MKWNLVCIVLGLGLSFTNFSSRARSAYVDAIPNGAAFACATCHVGEAPGLNTFGASFYSNNHVWDGPLAAADSDNDGASNGRELGDPAGDWRPGAAAPASTPANPGDAASNPPLPAPPKLTSQPESQSVTEGATVSFSVAAAGDGPLAYQWQKDGTNLPGANLATLTLSEVSLTAAGSYRAVVSNQGGAATSSTAILTINTAAVPPKITTSPLSQIVAPGASVTFTVAASSPTPMTYQWQKDGNNIPDATSDNLRLTSVSPVQAGSYRVVVRNAVGSAISASAALTVLSTTNPPVKVALSVKAGNARLTVKGVAGARYRIEYSPSLEPNAWRLLQELALPTSNYVLVTTIPADVGARYYRALPR